MVQDKNYPLTHALAYETTIDDEETIVVVLSGQAISSEKLKEARETEKDGNDAPILTGPTSSSSSPRPGNSSIGALALATRS